MAAAVVELDALADAVGAAAEDQHLAAVPGLHFVALFIGGVVIGRVGFEFRGAGIHQVEGGHDAHLLAQTADVGLGTLPHLGELTVGEAVFLGFAQDLRQLGVQGRHVVGQAEVADAGLHVHDVAHLADEPGVDARRLVDLFHAHAGQQGLAQGEDAARMGLAQAGHDLGQGRQLAAEVEAQAGGADLHGTQALLQGFLEGAADAHGLAHALHGGGQLVLGAGEFFKGEARDLDHAVVDGRLETGRGLAGDVVAQFVQGIADGQLGGQLGDGETGGLGGQGRGTRHARVHLDDHHLAIVGIDAELHVAAAGLHADDAFHRKDAVLREKLCVLAHHLVLGVGQGLGRGHGDGVTGVHAHGVHVLDGADDDAVVILVTHDFHLELFPAQHALLDHDFGHGTGGKAVTGHFFQVGHVVGDAAAGAAQGEGRADDEREGQHVAQGAHFIHVVGNAAGRHLKADALHGLPEQFAAFGLFDDFGTRTDELHAALRQNAALGQTKSGVERRLSAKGLHGLGAGIVEFTALADDDGTCADNQNFV